jgi:hypothetical protein
MKRNSVLGLLLLLAGAIAVQAQSGRVPTYGQFPTKLEKATARAIDFKNSPGAWGFRTRLRDALRRGVNFSGRYILTGWGCGTGCVSGAIIDARTGRVYFPDEMGNIGVGDDETTGMYYERPVEYRKNSRLLVIHGIPGTQIDENADLPTGDYFYEWKNNRLRLISSVLKK